MLSRRPRPPSSAIWRRRGSRSHHVPTRRNQVANKGASAGELVVHAHRLHGDVVLAGDDTESGRLYIERARQWFETQPEQWTSGLRMPTKHAAKKFVASRPPRSFRIRYIAPAAPAKRGRATTPPAIALQNHLGAAVGLYAVEVPGYHAAHLEPVAPMAALRFGHWSHDGCFTKPMISGVRTPRRAAMLL
jgi:hypothetical protein